MSAFAREGLGGINQPHIQLGFHRDVPKQRSPGKLSSGSFLGLSTLGLCFVEVRVRCPERA